MAEKTVLKQILTKWGSLDTQANSRLFLALKYDQAPPSSMDIETAMPIYAENQIEDQEAEEVTNEQTPVEHE